MFFLNTRIFCRLNIYNFRDAKRERLGKPRLKFLFCFFDGIVRIRYETMHPIVKTLKILDSRTLMAFWTTPWRIVSHSIAGSDGRVRQIMPRRWNSTNDWPAGLQFMPIKMQNYDVRVSCRQMAFLGFRTARTKPIPTREDPFVLRLISLNYSRNSSARTTIRVQNGSRVKTLSTMIIIYIHGNYDYYLRTRLYKYFILNISLICANIAKNFYTRSFTRTDKDN